MPSGIEARYLKIEWQAEAIARSIEAGPIPLEIEPRSEGGFVVETAIFNDFHPWLGLRLGKEFGEASPCFVTPSGQRTPLLRVADPQDGGWWWLQNDGWDGAGKRHLSELQRSAGVYRIRIGDVILHVVNQMSTLGQADIQAYVDDFKGDLLWMVMNDVADATAMGGSTNTGAEFAAALEELHTATHRVFATPAVAIREGQARQPVAKVRPKLTTFREYARNPSARQLTGRVFVESADTAENRYVRQILTVATQLAGAYVSAASLQADFLGRLASQESERALRNRQMDVRVVDPEVFDQQTEEIRQKLEKLASFEESSGDGQGLHGQFPIHLGGRYKGKKYSFHYKRQDGKKDKVGDEIKFSVVRFSEKMFELVLGVHHFCPALTIEGHVLSKLSATSTTGNQFREIYFVSVHEITPQTDVLERKAAKRTSLEKSGWKVRVSDAERRELRREAATAERRAEKALARKDGVSFSADAISRASAKLAKTDAGLEGLGISRSPQFPMGMRFVSNPGYAACISAFKKVRALFERDGLDVSRLNDIDRIGILHVSDIYEKWCMLKIFMTLVDDFRFEPEPGWKEKLVSVSLSRANNVRFELWRDDLNMKAIFTCQAVMTTGRRPDFVLEILDQVASKSHYSVNGTRHGLVMDAKFRSVWKGHGPRHMLDELVAAKGYGEALPNGKVFILQPCEGTVRPPASPLEWGRHCDYGNAVSHHQGWIQAGVARSGARSTHHLKRLLAMAFQDAFSEPEELAADGANGGVSWVSCSFCIGCGERHASTSIQAKTTKGGSTRWLLDCKVCGVWTVRTHCYNCRKSLFKNGTMWTYHGTQADEATNVICPQCGSYFNQGSWSDAQF